MPKFGIASPSVFVHTDKRQIGLFLLRNGRCELGAQHSLEQRSFHRQAVFCRGCFGAGFVTQVASQVMFNAVNSTATVIGLFQTTPRQGPHLVLSAFASRSRGGCDTAGTFLAA
ncbi:MAG: hypothetical protein L0Y44_04675 [Phycisphaerales bacterium]|nr:hypothetical protein [Phycisphaerales bacterium]MCI0629931.1 hypothetical protein [Phycisphaerales bacterium]